MSQRKLTFDESKLSFLLLNIIGHDPIHDFGQPSCNKWQQVRKQIDVIKPLILANDKKRKYQFDSINEDERTKKGGGVVRNGPERIQVVKVENKFFKKNVLSENINMRKFKKDDYLNAFIKNYKIPKVESHIVSEFEKPITSNANVMYDYLGENIDSSIIKEYFETLQCDITIALFSNFIKYKRINDDKITFTSLLRICEDLFASNDELETLSQHLHNYIISLLLLRITENLNDTIVIDAVISKWNTITVRYVLINFGHFKGQQTNTDIINENERETITVDFDINIIIDNFFKSKYYFFESLATFFGKQQQSRGGATLPSAEEMSPLPSVKSQRNSVKLPEPSKKSRSDFEELRSGVDTLNSSSTVSKKENPVAQSVDNSTSIIKKDVNIKNIRKILNFKDGVFNEIMVDDDNVVYTIQKIKNAAYYYTMGTKGYLINDNAGENFSHDKLKAAFYVKNNPNTLDLDDKLSTVIIDQRKTIISLYSGMFRQLGMDENTVSRIVKTLGDVLSNKYKRNIPRIDESIDKNLSSIFKTYYQTRKDYDDKIRKDQIKENKDNLAASSGKLTNDNKEIAYKFISFIAKSALYLTDCCDSSGNIIQKGGEEILDKEIECIRAIAGRDGPSTGYWKLGAKVLDIDTQLFSYIKNRTKLANTNITQFTEEHLKLKIPQLQYVINNAANISQKFRLKAFCPYTSILDGMSQCSWKSAESNKESLEFGNMDFAITNEGMSKFYNGTMKIIDATSVKIGLNIKLSKCTIVHAENIQMNSDNLVAHVVLRKTLDSIVLYIDEARNSPKNRYLYAEADVFQKLFEIGVDELSKKNESSSANSSHPNSIFTVLFKNILFKGVGDIFQEINAIAKFGGYTGDQYKCGSNIEKYMDGNGNGTGNASRCFVAKDRVSVSRYLFIRGFGKDSEINLSTSGGYIDGFNSDINMGWSQKLVGGNVRRTSKNKKYRKITTKTRKNKS
jgi:hypothetical protein